MKTKSHYKIGELARLSGISVEAIRFYEQKGLLKSDSRTPSGYRLFTEYELNKLGFILRAKAVGFRLDEISELLDLRAHADEHSCGEVKDYTAQKISEISAKIDELTKIKLSLEQLHHACCGGNESALNCSILQLLDDQNAENQGESK